MIREEELESIKKHLGSDGKLIIDSSLTDKQRERFEFINSLDIDLMEVLTRNTQMVNYGDEELESDNSSDDDDDDIEVIDGDDENANVGIEENGEIDDSLEDFF